MSLVASGKIAPSVLVESLIQIDGTKLEDLPFGPLVLIVRSPPDDYSGNFLKELVECVLKESPVQSEPPGWLSTSEFPTLPVQGREPNDADQVELLSELASAPHCIVPLRGRQREIILGRSSSCEIVLSDPSVSGQHARIVTGDGGARLFDLSSKNGTTVNGQRVVDDAAPWLQPMDRLSFGRIQAFACDPRALRGVLRQDLRTLL
jgi:FHA domain